MDDRHAPVRTQETVRRRLDLEPVLGAAPETRRALTELLCGTAFEARVDDATLAASELVSNAVLHGREPLSVLITLSEGVLRVEVRDGSPISPSFSMLDPTAMTGRGLLLVASAADRWGVEPLDAGKAVWFELDAEARDDRGDVDVDALLAAWADDLEDPADEVVTVVLADLDVALTARSEAHVESLLRELQLLLATADPVPAQQRRVAERVIGAAVGLDLLRTEVKRQLAASLVEGAQLVDVRLSITRVDADAVRDFSWAMDEADRLSRRGDLLVEPADRDLSDARQRYLHKIIAQLSS